MALSLAMGREERESQGAKAVFRVIIVKPRSFECRVTAGFVCSWKYLVYLPFCFLPLLLCHIFVNLGYKGETVALKKKVKYHSLMSPKNFRDWTWLVNSCWPQPLLPAAHLVFYPSTAERVPFPVYCSCLRDPDVSKHGWLQVISIISVISHSLAWVGWELQAGGRNAKSTHLDEEPLRSCAIPLRSPVWLLRPFLEYSQHFSLPISTLGTNSHWSSSLKLSVASWAHGLRHWANSVEFSRMHVRMRPS